MKVKFFELSFNGETTTFISDRYKNFGEDRDLRAAATELANELQVNDRAEPEALIDYTIEELFAELTRRLA